MTSIFNWINNRSLGIKCKTRTEDVIHRSLYKSMKSYNIWNNGPFESSAYGSIYNLEFSPDGSVLAAACQNKAVLLFDPITNSQTFSVKNAHQDCVNCVKFLDQHLFATCSDDCTIALWDIRNLDAKVRSLHGHLNWVKNIEYSKHDHLLVTSGFDGSIFTWDINSNTEQGLIYQKVFSTTGMMRCRISPDETKLVICTTGGYLIIIHNLDLATLSKDLNGFRPNIYRLMQMGRQFIPYAAKYDYVFTRAMKKNRVEIVSDFPLENDAEVISSLQIHPQGWCALSRNLSHDESSEWTCVHDIQKWEASDDETDTEEEIMRQREKGGRSATTNSRNSGNSSIMNSTSSSRTSTSLLYRPAPVESTGSPDIWTAEIPLRNRVVGSRARLNSNAFGSIVHGIISGVMPQVTINQPTTNISLTMENADSPQPPVQANGEPIDVGSTWRNMSRNERIEYMNNELLNKFIIQNMRRMLYYIEEPNKGKGFIKELCFSSDGRIICSPYSNGIRLLAFTKDCSELPQAIHSNMEPERLIEHSRIECHSDIVVCAKFSPRQPLLASGCLSGKIAWYQPQF